MMQLNGNITCMVHYCIGHVGKMDGFTRKMTATNAKEYFSMDKNLKLCKKKIFKKINKFTKNLNFSMQIGVKYNSLLIYVIEY